MIARAAIPGDPRVRFVRLAEKVPGAIGQKTYDLTLDCGHRQRRRFMCLPYRVVCPQCPATPASAAE